MDIPHPHRCLHRLCREASHRCQLEVVCELVTDIVFAVSNGSDYSSPLSSEFTLPRIYGTSSATSRCPSCVSSAAGLVDLC